jgi:aldose sugar dehydrogenase
MRVLLAGVCAFGLFACAKGLGGGSSSERCSVVEGSFGPKGLASVRTEVVVDGLEVPWSLAFLPGTTDILVTERPGRLRLVRNGALVSAPVVTLTVAGDESGLLGLVLHPAFSTNRFFYLYFTAIETGVRKSRVERWKLAANALSASKEKDILVDIPAAQYHDGGRMRFGPDGMLYIGTGDARSPEKAQDPTSLSGKILRLTPDGDIPGDNPVPNNPLWLLGVRNTQGFDWVASSTLLVSDHGPSGELDRQGHDELNVAHKGDNLGWPDIYGCEEKETRVTPLMTFRTALPPGGAAFYPAEGIPEWRDSFLVSALGAKHLHRFVFDDVKTPTRVALHEVYFEGEPPFGLGRLREVILSPTGELYLTTSNCDGRGNCPSEGDRILRVVR